MIMRSLYLFFLMFIQTVLIAQTFQITFSVSGMSYAEPTIEVHNLTQGTTLSLSATDTLELVTIIGVTDHLNVKNEILIYPNPSEGSCRLEFFNQMSGDVGIELFDIKGKLLLHKDANLMEGNHSFCFGGLKSGVYSLKVYTPAGSYTERVISTGIGEGVIYLDYTGMNPETLHHAKLTSFSSIVQMNYHAGDILLFKGISGIYSRVITLVPTSSQVVNFEFIDCTDGDGNHYPVVTIGTQTWMAENLKTTKYINGTDIPNITDNSTWVGLSTGARCWYNNDSAAYAATYGALYNWYAVDNTNGLCPTGWHVPTDLEWQTMEMHLGMTQSQANSAGYRGTDEGGKMKEAGLAQWNSPNTGATNSSGFTALPGGVRMNDYGFFDDIRTYGFWWTSSTYSSTDPWFRVLYSKYSFIFRYFDDENYGFSVRCVKNY